MDQSTLQVWISEWGLALDDTDSATSQRPLAGSERVGDCRHSVHSTGAYQITFKAN